MRLCTDHWFLEGGQEVREDTKLFSHPSTSVCFGYNQIDYRLMVIVELFFLHSILVKILENWALFRAFPTQMMFRSILFFGSIQKLHEFRGGGQIGTSGIEHFILFPYTPCYMQGKCQGYINVSYFKRTSLICMCGNCAINTREPLGTHTILDTSIFPSFP